MEQEVKVTVELTFSEPIDKTILKDEIKNGVEGMFNHLRTNLNSVLVAELSRYKNGDVLNNLTQAKVIKVEEESEIYKTEVL